jgi:hypothetical protein
MGVETFDWASAGAPTVVVGVGVVVMGVGLRRLIQLTSDSS